MARDHRAEYQRRKELKAQKAADEAGEAQEDILSAEDEEPAQKKPRAAATKQKLSGEDFAGQPLFVAALGTAIGWITGRAFGPANRMRKPEAYAVALGLLRMAGRHLLKHVDMGKLAKVDGDAKDAALVAEGIGNFLARRMQENESQQGQPQRQAPRAAAQPEEQNGHQAPAQEYQDAQVQAVFDMPYMGQEAA